MVVQLRLRGFTVAHAISATTAAAPLVYLLYVTQIRGASFGPRLGTFLLAAVGVALLPWMSRAIARLTYRASCDEIAVHIRGESLTYKTITKVTVRRTFRRSTLVLQRGATTAFYLVLWDRYGGRLEPFDVLAKHLESNGLSIPA
jgi:hypothetical protein